MTTLFEKLNLGGRQEIVVLQAPESFASELAKLPVITIHHHLESVAEADFWLAFVTRKSEVDKRAPQIARCGARAAGQVRDGTALQAVSYSLSARTRSRNATTKATAGPSTSFAFGELCSG
jgi:hypothetical protein